MQKRLIPGWVIRKAPQTWSLHFTHFQPERVLHCLSESTGDDVLLLFFRQRVETHRVTRHTNGQLRVFLRMLHRIQQHFAVHDVHVQVLTAFDRRFMMEVTVHQARQVGFAHFVVFTQRVRHDREGIRDTIFRIGERQFSNRGQRSDSAFLVTAVHRVSTWAERCASAAAIRGVTGFLTINHVRGNGQHGLGRDCVAVGFQFLNFLHETFNQVNRQVIHASVVVTELRVFAFDFEVDSQTVFIANRFNFRVFDGRQGVSRNRQTCDTTRHSADNVAIVQRHQRSFVAVFVMHVVDDVQGGDVLFRQPVHEVIHTFHNFVEIQQIAFDRFRFRAYLHFQFFINAAVDSVQHGFREVSASTEELHLLTNHHRAYAACDSVVVVVEVRTHQVIVLVLQRRGVDGNFRREFFEVQRQFFGPQNRDVRLRRRPHGVEGVQEAEAVFGYQRTAVNAHTTNGFGRPDRVAGEQLIIFRCTQEAHHTQFHHQVVDQFLGFLLGEFACFQVAFDVHVKEGGDAAKGHRGTVLGFHRSQVAEVSPLHGFLSVGRRTGDITAIFRCHLFDLAQRAVLFSNFFTQTDSRFQVYAIFQVLLQRDKLCIFVFHQEVDTVQRNAAVVTDNTATAVSIRQTGQHAGFTAIQDVFGVNVEYALVVGFTVFGEDFFQLRIQLAVVRFAGTFNHFDTAKWDNGAFQRSFSLQTNNFLKRLVDIACVMRSDGGRHGSVEVYWRMSAVFQFDAFHNFVPQGSGGFSCASQEGLVTLVWRVVFLDKVADVDFILPVAFRKTFPGCG
ncbi:hypothetical protein ESA_02442 [Cronobacter sakazakii ATCC BAA-894]|uniref:Uncharacterized protein n=1 Tax=Cronobacter sakazakii (strain ATCC BAA-894) TaxID=290339 RepID=A7MET3_CROS8|nr:hypothetical protein ESA_02442 [Cronobacter sakazakii ATCC BAA-894]